MLVRFGPLSDLATYPARQICVLCLSSILVALGFRLPYRQCGMRDACHPNGDADGHRQDALT